MFGQPQNSPFGSPPAGGFGAAPAAPGGFGTPAAGGFGAAPAAPGGFGGGFGASAPAPSAFGAPAAGGAFGTPAPASGFGGSAFGGAAPAPGFAPGGFGAQAPTPFGAPAPAPGGLFGSPAPAPGGGFGGSTLFGAPSPAPAASGFGGGGFGSSPAPAPAGFGSTGGFGSTAGGFGSTANTTPAFGAPSTTSAFGAAPAPSGGLFGAPAPSPGGFGSTGGFGSNTTTSAFGAPAASPGAFGAPAAPAVGAPGSGGTRIAQYAPTQRQDGQSTISLQSISAMQQYENKSFEELRFEDYSQGNKGGGGAAQPGAPAPGAFGAFGSPAPAPAPGLFGAPTPAPGGFGAPTPAPAGFGGFSGAPAPAAFGSAPPAPGAFGAAPAGAFGSTTPGAFGAKPPAAPGLFGAPPAPAPGGLFGQTQPPAPAGGGLFGATPAAPAPFGAPAAPAPGLFGAPAPTPAGGFGVFGGAPAPATGAFGAPAPAPGAFGAPAAGAFGAFGSPAPAPGAFGFGGAPAAPAPGAFGAPAPGAFGGLSAFGAKPPATPGIFGQPAPAPAGGLFGAPPAAPSAFGAQPQVAPAVPVQPQVGSVMPPAANDIMASQLAALESKRKELEEKSSFQSRPSPSAAITATSLGERESSSFASFTPSRLSFPSRRASPLSNAKVRPRGFASPPSDNGGVSLSKLGNGGRPMPTPESAAAAASSRLILNPTPKPKLKLAFGNDASEKNSTTGPSPLKLNSTNGHGLGSIKPSRVTSPFASPEPVSTPATRSTTNGSSTPSSATRAEIYYKQALGSPDASAGALVAISTPPKLTKDEYTCTPSIEILESLNPADLAAVPNFSVTRPGVGKVEWEGAVDVRGANLDKIVVIEPKAVSVYTEEEDNGTKPTVGTKLNRPAILTMEGIFPPEGASPEAMEKYKRKIAKQTMRMDADLIDYDPATGEWKLKVKHFSRYALDSDDESDNGQGVEVSMDVSPNDSRLQQKVDFQITSPDRQSKRAFKPRRDTPYKPKRIEEETIEMVSDTDMEEEDILEEADRAYERLQQMHVRENELLLAKKKIEQETTPFPEEGVSVVNEAPMETEPYVPSLEDMETVASMPSIVAKLTAASKTRTTNSRIDYGLRMGKSFRVGWSPDGSFISIGKNGAITRSAPKFANNVDDSEESMLRSHESNSQKIMTQEACPLLSIDPRGNTALVGKVLDTYSKSIKDATSMASNSFSLLAVVNETRMAKASSRGADPDLEARCMFAFNQFLISSCSHDVLEELANQGNAMDFNSLVAAISSGNLQLAAKAAERAGLPQLSIILTCPDSKRNVLKEMRSWKNMPQELKRAYRIIAGDVSIESKNKAFDWKRLMAMDLAYSENKPRDFGTFVHDYEAKVAAGDAPFPSPSYAEGGSTDTQDTLFKLLKLEGGSDASQGSLSTFVNPLGYNPSPHDFSLAFHLASAISGMRGQPRLALEEEESLIDGLKAQLLAMGVWEWSVYVSLCVLNPQNLTSSQISWRLKQAKSLVIQNYQEGDTGKSEFLKSIGVPTEWLSQALAYRNKANGDVLGFLRHTIGAGQIQEATEAFEKTLLPASLFVAKSQLSELFVLSEKFVTTNNPDSLVAVLCDLVDVANNIDSLEGASPDEIEQLVPELLKILDDVDDALTKYESGEQSVLQKGSLDMITAREPVPAGAFVIMAADSTAHMRLQIMALKSCGSSSGIAGEQAKLVRAGRSKDPSARRFLL
ncbi:MAG: hypothetical protein SGARI_000004 [Bacillariaceae sp.]